MVNFPGRNGRRRRVLNEEVLSASTGRSGRLSIADSDDDSHPPRYSDAAGVENHPQITDFIPRRYGTIGMLLFAGVAITAALAALDYFAADVAAAAGSPTTRPFEIGMPGSIAAWISAIVLFLSATACLLVYSIRRHRIDDFRGRYRVWLAAALVCCLLSANSVAGLHHVVGHALTYLTGWSALRDGAAWWLAIAGLPLTWIAVRILFDVRECRLAAAVAVVAALCNVTAIASYLGFISGSDSKTASLFAGAAALLGSWLGFTAIIAYARFVVLDAQGLITIRRREVKRQPKKEVVKIVAESKSVETKPTVLSVVNYARRTSQVDDAEDSKRWIDGSRPERKSYDDDEEEESSPNKVSKADRKRLRKLKTQNRAA